MIVERFLFLLRKLYKGNRKFLYIYLLITFAFHARPLINGLLMVDNGDPRCQDYPMKLLYSKALKALEFPMWNPYEFAGLPILGNIQVGVLYPFNLILYSILQPETAYNLYHVLHFALGGFFTFLYVRLVGVGKLPAFAAGLVFGFSGFLVTESNHSMIFAAVVYLPLIMYFLEKLRRSPELKYSFLIALTVAVQVFAGNFQICVYTYMVAGMFMLYYVFRCNERWRFISLSLAGIVLGIVITLPQLVSTLELSAVSFMRMKKEFAGYDYFSSYHVYLAELPGLFWKKEFFNGWGPEAALFAWVSPVVLVFAAIAFMKGIRKRGHAAFWGLVAIVSYILALGPDTPVHRLLYHVPVYNQFRVVGRHLMEFTFAVSVLFAMGLDGMLSGKRGYPAWFVALATAIITASAAAVFILPQLELRPVFAYLRDSGFPNPWGLVDALDIRSPSIYLPMLTLAAYLVWAAACWKFSKKAMGYVFVCMLLYEVAWGGGFIRKITHEFKPCVKDTRNMCTTEQYGEVLPEEDSNARYRLVNIFPPNEICSPAYNPMAHMTCDRGAVNAYNPLALDSYSNLLDLGLCGYYSLSWDHVVRNNIILSMLGGRYVTVSKNIKVDPEIVTFSRAAGPPQATTLELPVWNVRERAREEEDAFVLEGAGRKTAEITCNMSFDKGTYEFCLKARTDEKDKYFAVYLYEPPSYKRYEALFIHSDYIEKQYREFCQILHLDSSKKPYVVRAVTNSETPIYIKDITVKKFEHYMPPRLHFAEAGDKVYRRIHETEKAMVYLNLNAMPRAWSVEELLPVRDFSEARRMLNALAVDISRQALVYEDELEGLRKRKFEPAEVVIKDYGLNEVSLAVSCPAEGFVVLADQNFTGWKAYVDGKRTRIYTVNGVLRGVCVPSGNHSVTFKYRPYKTIALLWFSLALSTVLCVYIVTRVKSPFTRR